MRPSLPQILFRVDGGGTLGFGHLSRCFTLARQLMRHGFRICFMTAQIPDAYCETLIEEGIDIIDLPVLPTIRTTLAVQNDAQSFLSQMLMRDSVVAVVVDHYYLGLDWDVLVRPQVTTFVVFDDRKEIPHEAHLYFNATDPFGVAKDYSSLLPTYTKIFVGVAYAMIGSNYSIRRKPLDSVNTNKLFIFWGGHHPECTTEYFSFLEKLQFSGGVYVTGEITDADFKRLQALLPHFEILRFQTDLSSKMRSCQIFLGSAGGVTYERLALGLTGIVLSLASNQVTFATSLHEHGYHLYSGEWGVVPFSLILQQLAELNKDSARLKFMSELGPKLIDGQGVTRVAAQLCLSFINLRKATLADATLLFEGRNHSSVRAFALNSQSLDFLAHEKWLNQVLNDSSRHLFIADDFSGPLGVVRFDTAEPLTFEISVYLLPQRMGTGLGLALILAGLNHIKSERPQTQKIYAKILEQNERSKRAFLRAGFMAGQPFWEYVYV